MQGPIYKAIEWLDHQGMDLIEQVRLVLMLVETCLEQGDCSLFVRPHLVPVETGAPAMVAGRA